MVEALVVVSCAANIKKDHVVGDVLVLVVLAVFRLLSTEMGKDVLIVRGALLLDEIHEEGF